MLGRGHEGRLPPRQGHVGCYDCERNKLRPNMILFDVIGQYTQPESCKVRLTLPTIQSSAVSARYSTPPSSSSWSLESC